MLQLHENALLLEVREWLPPGWSTGGRNTPRHGSIRFVDPDGVLRGRLMTLREEGSLVVGVVITRRARPFKGSFETRGPTWDLAEPDSVDRIERWVRRKIFRQDPTPATVPVAG